MILIGSIIVQIMERDQVEGQHGEFEKNDIDEKNSVTIVENGTSLDPFTALAVGPFLQHEAQTCKRSGGSHEFTH